MNLQQIFDTHGPSIGLQNNPVQVAYAEHIERGLNTALAHGGGVLMAEAETGVGKTLGYLVPVLLKCVERGGRAIIGTHSIALQRQILSVDPASGEMLDCDMRRALDIVEAHTGKRLSAALRLGKRNFFDAQRTDHAASLRIKRLQRKAQSEDVKAQIEQLRTLREWARQHPGAEIRDYLMAQGLDALPAGITQQDICISDSTDRKGDSYAAYSQTVQSSKSADVLVTNHAMLIANSLVGSNRVLHEEGDPREIVALVVDEADRLPDAARSATSDLLPLREFAASASNWRKHSAHVPKGQHAADDLIDALTSLRNFMSSMREEEDNSSVEEVQFWDQLSSATRKQLLIHLHRVQGATKLIRDLRRGADGVSEEELNDLRSLQEYCAEFASVCSIAMSAHGQYETDPQRGLTLSRILALRWSPDRHYPSFRIFRLYPARVLKRMWSAWSMGRPGAQEEGGEQGDASTQEPFARAQAVVLTSATLSAPNRTGKLNLSELHIEFGVFQKDNACDALNQAQGTFSPKNFGSMKIVFSDPAVGEVFMKRTSTHDDEFEDIPLDYNQAWTDYQVNAIRAAKAQGGRILVLTNSYRANALLANALRGQGIDCIERIQGQSSDITENAFVAAPNGILLSPAAWEGFDISRKAGRNAIAHVVVTQIPFARPDGPVQQALMKFLTESRGFSVSKAQGVVYGNIRDAALRKACQAVGRGIRSAGDSFTLWLTDPRFPRSSRMREQAGLGGARPKSEFEYIIPKRFRNESGEQGVAWSEGSMLLIDGTLLEASRLEEEMI